MQRLPPVLLAAALSSACRGDDQPCWYSSFDFRDGGTVDAPEDLEAYDGRCVVIDGTLSVQGRGLDDLSGLEGVVGITGSLRLMASSLQSTKGLDRLEFVGGGLRISDSYALERIEFPSLETIGEVLIVERLPRLVTLDGFPVLDEVGADVTLRELDALTVAKLPPWSYIAGSLLIENNARLDSVVEPATLFEIGLQLRIERNPWLRRVSGFDALEWLTGGVMIRGNDVGPPIEWRAFSNLPPRGRGEIGDFEIADNRVLEDVSGFGSLLKAESLGVTTNPRLTRVRGLPIQVGDRPLDKVTGPAEVWITENPELTELPSLTGPSGRLVARDNESLPHFANLDGAGFLAINLSRNAGLRSLEGLNLRDGWFEVDIVRNDHLASFDGIGASGASSTIDTELLVASNASLTDVSALLPIDSQPATRAYIAFNPALPQAHASSVAAAVGFDGKAAGNLGWETPSVCPWQDGICDELPVPGGWLCPIGTDEVDCGW